MSNLRSKIPIDEHEFQHEYGMSFADLMSTLVGTFLILMMFFMYQNSSKTEKIIDKYEDKINTITKSGKAVDNVIVIRQNVIKKLKDTFKNSNLNVTIDYETGAIRFSDKILFDYDSDVVSPTGKEYLKQFIPKYISTILNDKTRSNVSEVIIEGHTDNSGPYLYNLDLSQRRALSVAKYVLGDEMPSFTGKEYLKQYLTTTGKSFCRLIYKNGKVDANSSRRVEFKFRLKGEDSMDEIQKALAN